MSMIENFIGTPLYASSAFNRKKKYSLNLFQLFPTLAEILIISACRLENVLVFQWELSENNSSYLKMYILENK